MADERIHDRPTTGTPLATDRFIVERNPGPSGVEFGIDYDDLLAAILGALEGTFVDSPNETVLHIERVTAAEYEALSPPDPDTVYIIVG